MCVSMYEFLYVCMYNQSINIRMYVYIHVWRKGGGVCVTASLYVNGSTVYTRVRNSRYEIIFVVLIVNFNKRIMTVLF